MPQLDIALHSTRHIAPATITKDLLREMGSLTLLERAHFAGLGIRDAWLDVDEARACIGLPPRSDAPDLRIYSDVEIERVRESFEHVKLEVQKLASPVLLPSGFSLGFVPPTPAADDDVAKRGSLARVVDVCVLEDGTGSLGLVKANDPSCSIRMQVSNAPSAVSELVGLEIWTDSKFVYLADHDKDIAIGELIPDGPRGCHVKLVDDERFDAAIADYYGDDEDEAVPPLTDREASEALVAGIGADADGAGGIRLVRVRDRRSFLLKVENAGSALDLVGRRVWNSGGLVHLGPVAIGRCGDASQIVFGTPEEIQHAIDVDDIPF